MRKTSVYLDDVHLERLRRIAESTGCSQAQSLRAAILSYAEQVCRPPDRDFLLFGIAEGPGGSVADIPEEELLKGFGQ